MESGRDGAWHRRWFMPSPRVFRFPDPADKLRRADADCVRVAPPCHRDVHADLWVTGDWWHREYGARCRDVS